MRDANLYEKIIMHDKKFPIKIQRAAYKNVQRNSQIFSEHWHEHLELWYLKKGEAIINHGGRESRIRTGDLAIANSNEVHSGYSLGTEFEYFCIIIDPVFFTTELSQGHFFLENIISGNETVKKCFEEVFEEYNAQKTGFDLVIKSKLYEVLAYLVRNHIARYITDEEYSERMSKLERIRPVIEYLEDNYNGDITHDALAKLVSVSKYHFCRLFKEATGKTVVQYINDIRLDKAYELLKNTDMNITQISMSVGFNDMNYFSRIFHKKKKIAPSSVRRSKMQNE